MTSTAKSTKGKTKKKNLLVNNKLDLKVPDAWVNELANVEINDKDWRCSVSVIEEQSTNATVYIEHFNESAINGKRLSIKTISKLEVMKTVVKNTMYGDEGKVITPLSLLTSEIVKTVGSGFERRIPTSLLAPLIKYMLLEYKDWNKTVREGIKEMQQELVDYQESLWQGSKVKSVSGKGTVSSKSDSKTNKLAKGKRGGGKAFTKLRRRGEEWKDVHWIDDAPIDGPQLYVSISTFFDADLPLALLKLNVPLNAIVKLDILKLESTARGQLSTISSDLKAVIKSLYEFKRKSTPYLSSNIRQRIDEKKQLHEKTTQIFSFWDTIHTLKNEAPTALMFKDVMFLDFVPIHSDFKYEIADFQEEIYRQVSHFLYDTFEITKHHKAYLSEVCLKNVTDHEVCELSRMKVYNTIMDSIPHESLNIPFLLDALVTQVCELTCTGKITEGNMTENPSTTIDAVHDSLQKLFENLNVKYDLFCDKIEFRSKLIGSGSSAEHKQVLINSDDIKIKTFHLENDLAEFIKIRSLHIIQAAWDGFYPKHFLPSHYKNNFVTLCNEIVNIKEEKGRDELYYYLHLLFINSIIDALVLRNSVTSNVRMTTLEENTITYNKEDLCEDCLLDVCSQPTLQDSHINKLSDNSYCPQSSYNLSQEIIGSNLFYIEDMPSDVLLQVLQATRKHFNHIEARFCPFSDQVVLVFHNLPSPQLFEEHWLAKLRTLVPIRDFVDYILDEERVWLNKVSCSVNEEYDDSLRPGSSILTKLQRTRLTLLFSDVQFLSQRSLKYETFLKKQNQDVTPTTTQGKSMSDQTKSSSARKSRDTVKLKASKGLRKKNSLINKSPLRKYFSFFGYDLGDPMRFQFSGFKKDNIFDDNCRITLKKRKRLYGDVENRVAVRTSGHTLYYTCRPYDETTSNTSPFHLVLSSGIVLYFGCLKSSSKHKDNLSALISLLKRTQQDSPPNNVLNLNTVEESPHITKCSKLKFEIPEEHQQNKRFSSQNSPNDIKEADYFGIPCSYDLQMSTPSGLHVELVKENGLLYVRQEMLSKGPQAKSIENEKYRSYLSSGHIMKFMVGGEVEVLGPNGAIYTIFDSEGVFTNKSEEFTNKKTSQDENKSVIIQNRAKENRIELVKYKTETSHSTNKLISKGKIKSIDETNSSNLQIPLNERNSSKILSIPLRNTTTEETASFLSGSVHYKFTSSDGKRYSRKGHMIETMEELLTISSIDIENNCFKSERLDGVNSKHLSDGSLVVNFPDGSRITSTPVEEEEFFCRWSTEEFEQWFYNPMQSQSFVTVPDSLANFMIDSKNGLSEESSLKKHLSDKVTIRDVSYDIAEHPSEHNLNKNVRISSTINYRSFISSSSRCRDGSYKPSYIEDGFVVYSISYLMEHPNYGSIYYCVKNCEVEFKLPFDTSVTLKADGSYETFFDGASLTVDDNKMFFKKVSRSGEVLRNTVINTAGPGQTSSGDFAGALNLEAKLGRKSSLESYNEFSFEPFLKHNSFDSLGEVFWVLLYSVDKLGNEFFVDYNLNVHELQTVREHSKIRGSDFLCFVVNKDLSGFRLVSENEVHQHVQSVNKAHGLVRKSKNIWESLFTSSPIIVNESQKWLMKYKVDESAASKEKPQVSTVGELDSWFQPFVEKKTALEHSMFSDVVLVRLLHKIPTAEGVLLNLKSVLKECMNKSSFSEPSKIFLDLSKVDLDLSEIVRNPNLIQEIYEEEILRSAKEHDKFRKDMKHTFLHSLVRQACIKARRLRQKKKEMEFKSILRTRKVPPYHLSCYGQVHEILDEVLGNAHNLRKTPSNASVYERVNSIVDEILSIACTSQPIKNEELVDKDKEINSRGETVSTGVSSLISEILVNTVRRSEMAKSVKIDNLINSVLEKPLELVTPEDVEFLGKLFATRTEDCPINCDEDFILTDILDARYNLSHYFGNLKELLKCYRGHKQHDKIKGENISCK